MPDQPPAPTVFVDLLEKSITSPGKITLGMLMDFTPAELEAFEKTEAGREMMGALRTVASAAAPLARAIAEQMEAFTRNLATDLQDYFASISTGFAAIPSFKFEMPAMPPMSGWELPASITNPTTKEGSK